MGYTFKSPSVDLKLRPKPEPEPEKPGTNVAREYGIRLDHWHEMQRVILHALLPHGQARTDVIEAIRKLQERLGVVL
jgi:hypothetical protein